MTRAFTQYKNAVGLFGAVALSQQVGAAAAANPFAVGDTGFFRDANDVVWFQDAAGNIYPAGPQLLNLTAGATIAAGQWCYINGAGQAVPAQANALATVPALVVALSAVANGATGNFQSVGVWTTTGLTPGATYYLSAATPGALVSTAPSAVGQFVQPVGMAASATQLVIFAEPAFAVGQPLGAGGQQWKRTAPAPGAFPYSALGSDFIVAVTNTAAARTVSLPQASAAIVGEPYLVKDESGAAGTNNITVNVTGGGTIDGAASKVINTNYGSLRFYTDGANWFTW